MNKATQKSLLEVLKHLQQVAMDLSTSDAAELADACQKAYWTVLHDDTVIETD